MSESPSRSGVAAAPSTQDILVHAFYSAVAQVEGSNADEDEAPDENVRPTLFDGQVFSLHEVLDFLGRANKCGAVSLTHGEETFHIELARGFVVNATSSNPPPGMRLGELLVAQGAITEEALDDFLERNGTRARLGEALENEEIVPRGSVNVALLQQISELFKRALTAEGVDVTYHPRVRGDKSSDLCINLVDCLLEGRTPEANRS